MKKILAMLLIAVMTLSMLTGCGTKETTNNTDDTTGNTEVNTSKDEDADTTTENQNEDVNTEVADEFQWPLAETAEFTVWLPWNNNYKDSPNELKGVQQIEKNTNVHIEWTTVSDMEGREKLGLLLASGEYPDIFYGLESYASGGLVNAYADGVIIDMTEYVEKYMPNYEAIRQSVDSVRRDTLTDDGKILGAYKIVANRDKIENNGMWLGLGVRKDWLNELGLEVPTTIDEWHTALVGFRDHFNCDAPLFIGASRGYDNVQDFLSAYGVLGDFYRDGDVVKFGPMEEGYRQWVELFRDWYAEGLIDPNFFTSQIYDSMTYLSTNRSGVAPVVNTWTGDYMKNIGMATDENFWLDPAPTPVLNEGDRPELGAPFSELTASALTVSTQCEDPVLACRWLDYWYTEECALLGTMGIEGESYVVNEDGSFSPAAPLLAMVENGTYQTQTDALGSEFSLGTQSFGRYDYNFTLVFDANPLAQTAMTMWNDAENNLLMPARISMTTEDNYNYSNYYTNIMTLVSESTSQFIMGSKSMDEYDAFIDQLKQYGVDECIRYMQEALDRYNAR